MKKIIVIVLASIILAGCFATTTQLSKEQVVSDNYISYRIPKDSNALEVQNTVLRGLEFSQHLERGFGRSLYPIRGVELQVDARNNVIVLTKINGEMNNGMRFSSFVRYKMHISSSEEDKNYILTFKPEGKEVVQGSDALGKKFDVPVFSVEDALNVLSTASLSFKTEVDSTYNTDSVYANFKRNLKEESYNTPQKDTVTGKIYASAFLLPLNGRLEPARLHVETFPYRNGTKAVVSVKFIFSGRKGEKIIDVNDEIDRMVQKIEQIVKS